MDDLSAVLRERYGECPLWTLSDIRRIDGAPSRNGYEVSYSFVLTLRDAGKLNEPGAFSALTNQQFPYSENGEVRYDICAYGLGMLSRSLPEYRKIYRSYQVTGDRVFVQSERGWHLIVYPDGSDPAPFDQLEPSADSQAAESAQNSSPHADVTALAGSDDATNGPAPESSIFHRLNLLVMSLFRGSGSHSGDVASVQGPATGAAATAATSEPAPAASPAENASGVADTDSPLVATSNSSTTTVVASAAASLPAPPTAVSNPPAVTGTTASPAKIDASTGQAAKLQVLLRKAQDEFRGGQYRSAVATAEAILLLDSANTQAHQLRARALRLEQEPPTQVLPPQDTAPAQPPTPPLAPATQPASRTLVLAHLEGDWRGTYQCGTYSGSGSVPDPDPWSHHVRLTIRNGQARLVRQSHGEHPYREVLAGTVAPDLTLQLSGTGQYVDAQHAWTTAFTGRFTGTTEQPAFQADGALTNWHGEKTRTCHLALGR